MRGSRREPVAGRRLRPERPLLAFASSPRAPASRSARRSGRDAPRGGGVEAVRGVVPARGDVRASCSRRAGSPSSAGWGSARPRSRSRRSGRAPSTSTRSTPARGCSRSCTSGRPPTRAPRTRQVAREFRERFGVRWLPPLGFENTYAIAVRRETATRLGLRTLSDLARVGPDAPGGAHAGLHRPRGRAARAEGRVRAAVPRGARAAPGREVPGAGRGRGGRDRRLLDRRADRAVRPGGAGPTTAGSSRPTRPRRWSGPASPSARPAAVAALTELSGRLERHGDAEAQPAGRGGRRPRARGGRRRAARAGAAARGRARRPAFTGERRAGLAAYLWAERATLLRLTRGTCCSWRCRSRGAIAVAVPLGLALERAPRGRGRRDPRRSACCRPFPGIALLAFMIPVLGIGVVPALVALFLYSLYPILRNTYTGVRERRARGGRGGARAGHDAAAGAAPRAPAARGAAHHGRHPHRRRDRRRHRDAGRLHRRRRPGRPDRRRPRALGHADDPLRRPARGRARARRWTRCSRAASGWCGRAGEGGREGERARAGRQAVRRSGGQAVRRSGGQAVRNVAYGSRCQASSSRPERSEGEGSTPRVSNDG